MTKQEMDRLLMQLAEMEHTTPEEVRREMQMGLDEALNNPDPVIRARWETIPRRGERVTLEEFIEYMAAILSLYERAYTDDPQN